MKGPIFPPAAEVRAGDLRSGDTSKSEAILQRQEDFAVPGVAEGLVVTVSGSTFAITAGRGYTLNGEEAILLEGASGQSIVSPAGDQEYNYVCVFYTENSVKPTASRLTGATANRLRQPDGQLVVLTQTQYEALPVATKDITALARERICITAVLRRQSSSSAITTLEIVEAPSTANTVLTISPANIAVGCVITAIDQEVAEGDALLNIQWDSDIQMQWSSPGSAYGSWVSLAQGLNTIVDDDGFELSVYVDDLSLVLPLNNTVPGPYPETLTVRRLYDATASRASARDIEHRQKQGGEIISSGNIHGTRLEQIQSSSVERLRGMLEVGVDLLANGDADILKLFGNLPKIVQGASEAALVDGQKDLLYEHRLVNSDGDTFCLRVYGASTGGRWITLNAKHLNELIGTTPWTRSADYGDLPGQASYLIRLNRSVIGFSCRLGGLGDSWDDNDFVDIGTGKGNATFSGDVLVNSLEAVVSLLAALVTGTDVVGTASVRGATVGWTTAKAYVQSLMGVDARSPATDFGLAWTFDLTDSYVAKDGSGSDTSTLYWQLSLPESATWVTAVFDVRNSTITAGTTAYAVKVTGAGPGNVTVIGSVPITTGGAGAYIIPTFSEVIDNSNTYALMIVAGIGDQIEVMRVAASYTMTDIKFG